jgi:hypothetical protein
MPSASRRTGDETIMGEGAAARTLAEGDRKGRGFAEPVMKAAVVGTAASAMAARAAKRTMASVRCGGACDVTNPDFIPPGWVVHQAAQILPRATFKTKGEFSEF